MLVVWSVVVIVALIGVLAGYLFVVGGQLTRVADLLEECAEIVREINGHAVAIRPGLDHINRTGGVVAGALPLLYGFAEGIVTGVSPRRDPDPEDRLPARPAAGTRRSRLHDGVGYLPAGVAPSGAHGARRTGA